MNHQHKNDIHTVLVSDLHLGSRISRSKDFYGFLEDFQVSKNHYGFSQIVLLGDIFDDLNFSKFGKFEWKIIGAIRKINDRRSNAKAIWIRGNHDEALVDLMSHVAGVGVLDEFQWRIGEKQFLAMHGDQFDKWVINWPRLSRIPDWIFNFIQKVDGKYHHFSRFIKQKSKTWLHINEEVAQGVVKYLKEKKITADAVFCGHTHIAEGFLQDGVMYYNTGSWTGEHAPTYITISHTGEVQIKDY
ncbi:MAG: hypothetical protein COT26_02235 [Candidatus Kerfeldbacteria bacterium CG08_land_8_20_14_0_20_43_14]|uniref:Calcineurin-like phosphoesterase domain-containing protein n=1 Tax=Candidatus Kerfeldbacteria bacterium CG08_land_8_20_14_0_20_43_14 TaxID=2014246 RepID=A0A2H0YQ94_9BACT|nr:MAG: hypothetical protein COT26_02235 [Candidatus Kerfeldbacteria bacterium CG08_land_8_20_14_0_20_43_14]